MIEVFLIAIAIIWIVFAVFSDFKTREVPNWLNFSLIAFALGSRFFYSLFSDNFGFFIQGLIGLAIFFVLHNLFYYGRLFAGGDAKLMLALGPVIPLYSDFSKNLELFADFFIIFFVAGAGYGIIAAIYSASRNFSAVKKKFMEKIRTSKKMMLLIEAGGVILIVFSVAITEILMVYAGIIVMILPVLYLYAKAIDGTTLLKTIDSKKLTEGDWLHKNVKAGRKTIIASWGGVTRSEINEIRKFHKKVTIKEGVPFTPVFLVTILIFAWLYFSGTSLWNSLG